MAIKTAARSDKNQKLNATLIYVANLLCLIIFHLSFLGIIVSIIFLLVERKKSFVRFHALQSSVLLISILVLDIIFSFTPGIGRLLYALVTIVELILWILLILKTYQGARYKLPYIGDLAEKLLKKMG